MATLWAAIALGSGILASSAGASEYAVQSITPWKQNAAPMGWSSTLNRVFYNSRGADGLFDAYSANPDGSGVQCVTCTMPILAGAGTATQRGVSDVSSDGKYMLLSVERGTHGGTVGDTIAEPGKGAYDDVWLATTDGTKAWPLTNIDGVHAIGTMWARFDRTGQRVVWAELYAPAILNLGYWRLKVANIVWSNGVPSLANVTTIEPQTNHFYEPYGFTPDGSRIIFDSDLGMPNWWDSQVYSIATNGTGLVRLSPADAPTGFFTNYNEFAFYLPTGDKILYGRTRGATGGGMEYWLMNPDGTDQQRLTFFNEWWHTEYRKYTIVGGLAFDPNNPDRFIAGISPDMTAHQIDSVAVTLNNPQLGGGLTGQYFADMNFGRLVMSRVENPSNGFKWDSSPAPGMPANNYSVRWSGTVTGPSTGTYNYCAAAGDGARLWVAGKLIINAPYEYGQRLCGSVVQTANVPVPIQLDFTSSFGTGNLQLTWEPPGSTTPGLIPSAALAPAGGVQGASPATGGTSGRTMGSSGSPSSSKTATKSNAARAKSSHRARSSRRARRRAGAWTSCSSARAPVACDAARQ